LIIRIFLILISLSIFGCSKENNSDNSNNTNKNFVWKENLTVADIPDDSVKGYLNGKEVKFEYINFEKWRGSGDNVLNFSTKRPMQDCGFIENDNAFSVMIKNGDFQQGENSKILFSTNNDNFISYFHYYVEGKDILKVEEPWSGIVIIESIDEKKIKGRLAIVYNDEAKSWIAGKFEAIKCNN